MYEIFTIGGGRFLFNFFNAVAALMGTAEYKFAMTTATLAATTWMLTALAFRPTEWGPMKTWLASSILVVGVLTTPSFTVKITDRINRIDSTGYIVANVPAGLAVFASLTSTVGDTMTGLFEDNFTDVDAPKLREHGFLFGVRLLAESTRVEIKNTDAAFTMSSYVQNCFFYDVLLGRKSFGTFANRTDPWEYMSEQPSTNRYARLFTGTLYTIQSCAAVASYLDGAFTAVLPLGARNRLASWVSPASDNINETALRALVSTELPNFNEYFTGASRTAYETLIKQMVINAVAAEPANWQASVGNSAALEHYTNARQELQTTQSYRAIARQAEKWVPLLKVVFQCIYYGSFPIAVLLMLSPIGGAVFRNYIFGLVWIESWGPLYAIINYIMNSEAQSRMKAVITSSSSSLREITFSNQAGIQAVEADISVMAGYLSMSVPFLAIALASGASRFASLATSTLAVTQEAVSSTTQETVTGNFSLGNTQLGNHSFNNLNGNKVDSSWRVDDNFTSARGSDGAWLSQSASGRWILRGEEGYSSFPTSVSGSNVVTNQLSEAATYSRTAAQGYSVAADTARSSAQDEITQFSRSLTQGSQHDSRFGRGESNTRSNDASTILRFADDLAVKNNTSQTDALSAILAARASVGGKIFGTGLEASATGRYENAYSGSISYDDALSAGSTEQVSEALNRTVNTSFNQTDSEQYGDSTSLANSIGSRLSEVHTLTESRNASLQDATRLEEGVSQVRANSTQINQNYAQPFFEYVARQQDDSGRTLGQEGASALLLSPRDADIVTVGKYADNFIEERGLVQETVSSDVAAIYNRVSAEIKGKTNIAAIHEKSLTDVPGVESDASGSNLKDVFNADTALTETILGQAKKEAQKTQDELDGDFANAKALSEQKRNHSEGEVNRLKRRTQGQGGEWGDGSGFNDDTP